MAIIHIFSPVLLVVLLLAAVVAFLASPACSTTPKEVEHSRNNIGFRVELKHVDSGKNFTKFEQIQHGIKRGRQRLQNINAMALDEKSVQISSPISPGNGEFIAPINIGTPEKHVHAIIDTGSDLTWTQCSKSKQTRRLFNKREQTTPLFNPDNSSSFSLLPCSNELCKALPYATCGGGGCEYYYHYGDGSSTKGIMAFETLTFGDVSVLNVAIGCGEDTKDDGFNPGAALVGLGRGPLSLVSQLKEPKFAYCVSYTDATKSGILLMGSLANLNPNPHETKTTPLIKNPSLASFYYLSLEGITVGGTKLSIKKSVALADGKGGLIIDSGTTVTFLERSVFYLVAKLFTEQIKLAIDNSNKLGLPLCFKLRKESVRPIAVHLSESNEFKVPEMILHFDGADLRLPEENYMIEDKRNGLICLAMVPALGISIFGNFQQQNILVIHDLVKETVSFVPRKCPKI